MSRRSAGSPRKAVDSYSTPFDEVTVPPLHALLNNGCVPSLATFDLFLHDLDLHLEQSNKEIDSCLQSVLRFTNDLPGSKTFSTPKDGLVHMLNSHVLEKDSCYDPELDNAMAILERMQQTLERQPGSEELVLQEVLRLASTEGLLLPLRSSSPSGSTTASTLSLHTVLDTTDQVIEQKWNQVAQVLKRYLVEQLLQLPVLQNDSSRGATLILNRRLSLLNSLRAIASDEDVWNRYRTLRTQQLEKCFNSLLPENEDEQVDYKEFTKNCSKMADIIINMIDEDFVVLNTGIFRKVTGVFKAIHDLYLEKYSDEMSLLVEEINDEVSEARHKVVPQSRSEHGLHGNHVGPAPLASTHSMDSMMRSAPPAGGGGGHRRKGSKEPPAPVPQSCVDSVLHIVLSIQKIEAHVEALLRNTSWEVTGLTGKKKDRKGSLRGVLKPSSSPEMGRHSINLSSYSNSDSQLDVSSDSGPIVSLPPAYGHHHGGASHTPKVIERTKTEDRLHWDWKLCFKKLSGDLAGVVEGRLLQSFRSALDEELLLWEKSQDIRTVPVPDLLIGGKRDYPPVISQSVHQFAQTAEQLLPLAKAGCEGCLLPVRTAFVDSTSLAAKNFHMHFTKLSRDVLIKVPVKALYVILSSVVCLRNHLQHYDAVLSSDESKSVFGSLLKQQEELVTALVQQTTDIHQQLLTTSVLHDADSNNWSQTKEFYEEERCSFTIQMWNLHIRGLRNDLWSLCPPCLGQDIFARVLHQSLHTLTQRYVHATPSFRRVKQYRCDIVAMLLCVEEFLFFACSSPSQLYDPGHTELPHYSIHNLCSTLLSAIAVIASPIDTMYRVFKRGYPAMEEEETLPALQSGGITQWLHWIRPGVFSLGQKHYEDMQTTTALYLQLNILLHQPRPSWSLLLQALVMKEYTLPIVLLMRTLRTEGGETDRRASQRRRSDCTDRQVKAVFSAIFNTLSVCHHFPDALARVVMPVIAKFDQWKYLQADYPAGGRNKVPVWIEALFDLMEPFIVRLVEPVLGLALTLQTSGAQLEPLLSDVEELPCGCQPSSQSATRRDREDDLERAVKLLLTKMSENVFSLSTPLCMAFSLVNEACFQRQMDVCQQTVGLQLLAWCLGLRLSDAGYLESLAGRPVSSPVQHLLSQVAECCYDLLVRGKSASASQFSKSTKDFLADKIHSVVHFLTNSAFAMPDADILEGATTCFTDLLFQSLAQDVLDTSTGHEDLKTILGLLQANQEWLYKQLDIPPLIPTTQTPEPPNFTLQPSTSTPAAFSPVDEFARIGSNPFDQKYLMELPLDWERLLTSDLGLSLPGFRALLFRRQEMQEGAFLEDSEKKPVDVLKAVFDSENSGLK